MLIVNKTMNEVGFIIEDYNGFTEHKEEELAKLLKNLKVTLNLTLTRQICLPPHAPVAQEIANQR